MAELYVYPMRDALKDFHKNVLTTDYNKFIDYYGEAPNDAFYEAVAWRGLKDYDVKTYTDLLDKKKKELDDEALDQKDMDLLNAVKDVLLNEFKNKSNAKGNKCTNN